MKVFNKKKGFSTAELLVAIALVGALAVMTIPTLRHVYRDKVLAHSRNINQQRLAQGITMLAVRSPRLAYTSSFTFATALSQYTKLLKVCNSSKISECWPTEKITLPDGSEYAISGATGPSVFMRSSDTITSRTKYSSDNAAFVMVSGATVILNFDQECNPNTSDENKTCYAAIMDVNGDKAPNKVGVDIFLLNAEGFAGVVVPEDLETAGVAGSRIR